MSESLDKAQTQKTHSNSDAVNALDSLLTTAGFDAGDLQIALEAIKQAKELSLNKKKDDNELQYYLDKTLVYEDRDAYIYRRATSKSGRWYLRIYDFKSGKPVIKSLKTIDKVQALTTARMLYIEIKGKMDRGERLKSISTMELVEKWELKLKSQISDIPHTGLTLDSFKQKQYFLKNWRDYLIHLRLHKTAIDKIEPSKFRDFGTWLKQKPKETALHTGKGRCLELVNNNISEVIRMHHQLAIREKYISLSHLPEIDRVKVQLDEGYKRDIMNEEQYEKIWKYIQFKYITKKANPLVEESELEVRKIWKEFIFIMSNVGFRPKELLGIKISEISENPNWDDKRRETDVLMKVRKENSKTGRARVCVAPVKKRIERIIASYQKLGITHQPDDFLFIAHRWVVKGKRVQPSRQMMYERLKIVMQKSGLKEELGKEGKRISLYSFRHQYAFWRLRYGDVPIHLLAKQMGTSYDRIMSTYGHITVEQEAEKITKDQGILKRTGFVFTQPEVIEEEKVEAIIADIFQSNKYARRSRSTKKEKVKV